MPKRPRGIHIDSVESLLDKLGNTREVLLSIERSLERMQTVKPRQRRKKSRKKPASRVSASISD
jgi:hypothetical protein